MKFKNLLQLLDHFKDEETCRAHLEFKRWGGQPACHHCGSLHVYRTNRGFKCGEKLCGKKFSVLTGSLYENSKLPIRVWFGAIYLITSAKKGVSSLQIARQLGVSQKSAWFLNHRIREMLKEKAPRMLKEEVQLDESYYGGKEMFKQKSKRQINVKGKWEDTKVPIIGIVDKEGNVVLKTIPWVTKKNMAKIIDTHIEKGSIMVTDSHPLYVHLRDSPYYKHQVVNHKTEEYVNKDGFHTNTVEGVFSLVKRGLYGIYHSVSEKHLQRYLNEFCLRYNTRKIGDDDRFDITFRNCEGRLKYKDLIKTNDNEFRRSDK